MIRDEIKVQGMRIRNKEVKDMSRMTFSSRKTLEYGHCYLGSRPTVDTALIISRDIYMK